LRSLLYFKITSQADCQIMSQMRDTQIRKPIAIANWKMAMTVSESLAYVQAFRAAVASLAQSVEIVLCPPYTILYILSQALGHSAIDVGAQNLCASPGKSHTGEVSAQLLVDAGCKWVMLGHWEIRRRTGETDADINNKMHAAFQAGLQPIVLIGEGATERGQAEQALAARLPNLFTGCNPGQAGQAAVIYEPEWSIGAQEPAPPDYVAASCSFIRRWIGRECGADAAESVRIIYGGSVAPEHAQSLLASPDVDGLGAGRQGRDPVAFAQIVQRIAATKGLI
jgi:triosephosphate isomerase